MFSAELHNIVWFYWQYYHLYVTFLCLRTFYTIFLFSGVQHSVWQCRCLRSWGAGGGPAEQSGRYSHQTPSGIHTHTHIFIRRLLYCNTNLVGNVLVKTCTVQIAVWRFVLSKLMTMDFGLIGFEHTRRRKRRAPVWWRATESIYCTVSLLSYFICGGWFIVLLYFVKRAFVFRIIRLCLSLSHLFVFSQCSVAQAFVTTVWRSDLLRWRISRKRNHRHVAQVQWEAPEFKQRYQGPGTWRRSGWKTRNRTG